MLIALTGATGFVGRAIALRLAGGGHQLRCWRRPGSDAGGFEPVGDCIEWASGELGDRGAAERLVRGCDAAVHAALWRPGSDFRGGEGELIRFVETNLVGSLQLIEAARLAGVKRFVFISTCAVHEQILDDRPLDETHPLWPASHYGAHKAALEKFVHSYGLGGGFSICALRPTGVYGVARPVEHSKWFELVCDVARGETVHCQSGGKEVHVDDVARAAELLLAAKDVAGQCYNCCDMYVSQYDVASLAKQLAASDCRILGGQTRPKHQIVTDKIVALGMTFGGRPLLEQTVAQLVEAASNRG